MDISKKVSKEEMNEIKDIFKDYIPITKWGEVLDEIHSKANLIHLNQLKEKVNEFQAT